MLNVLNTIGKPIISLDSGKSFGYVNNVEVKNGKVFGLISFLETSEEKFLIPTSNIYCASADVITLKSELNITLFDETQQKLLGTKLINEYGKILGEITNIDFDETSFKITSYQMGENSLSPLVINQIKSGYAIMKGKAKIKRAKQILSEEQNNIKLNKNILMNGEEKKETKQIVLSPSKAVGNFGFLVGRKLTQNLLNKSGKVVLHSGEILTEQNINKAIISGNINFVLKNSLIV